jgi:hypothetical protein
MATWIKQEAASSKIMDSLDGERLLILRRRLAGTVISIRPMGMMTKQGFLSPPSLYGYSDQARSDVIGKPWMISMVPTKVQT